MKWFLNLPTQSKLFMGFGLIVVLLIASLSDKVRFSVPRLANMVGG